MKYEYPSDGTGKIMVHQGLNRVRVFCGILNWAMLLMLCLFFTYCVTHDVKVVVGESMQPTINSSWDNDTQYDLVILNKASNISRGDIIIVDFSDYGSNDLLIIKRVIAVAGDTINIQWDDESQNVVINLKKAGSDETEILAEDYIKQENYPLSLEVNSYCASSFQAKSDNYGGWINSESYTNLDGSITIPDGYFFALGDNRELSLDCSEVGPLSVNTIVGVVDTIVPNGTFLNNILRNVFGIRL